MTNIINYQNQEKSSPKNFADAVRGIDKKILRHFKNRSRIRGYAFEAQKNLAKEVGLKLRTVERSISRLKRGLFIEIANTQGLRGGGSKTRETRLTKKGNRALETATLEEIRRQQKMTESNNRKWRIRVGKVSGSVSEKSVRNTNENKELAIEKNALNLSIDLNLLFNNKSDKSADHDFKKIEAKEEGSLIKKTTTAQDMLKIWNSKILKSPTNMSKALAARCVKGFKDSFNSDLSEWEHYCDILASSEYIMGSDFKLVLHNALGFGFIRKIRSGELGVQTLSKKIPNVKLIVDEHIQKIQESEPCKVLRKNILSKHGYETYRSWFMSVQFVESNGIIDIIAPNTFHKDWINSKYGDSMSVDNHRPCGDLPWNNPTYPAGAPDTHNLGAH